MNRENSNSGIVFVLVILAMLMLLFFDDEESTSRHESGQSQVEDIEWGLK